MAGNVILRRNLRLKNPRMRGEDVKSIQKMLQKMGYSLGTHGPDGIYGPASKQAVISFQARNDLSQDGVVGPQTVAAIRREYSDSPPPTAPEEPPPPPPEPRAFPATDSEMYEITPSMEEKNKVISKLFDFYQKESSGRLWNFSLDSAAFLSFYPIVKSFISEFESSRVAAVSAMSDLGLLDQDANRSSDPISPRIYFSRQTGKLDKVICFPDPGIRIPRARYSNGIQTSSSQESISRAEYRRDFGCIKLTESDFREQNNRVFVNYLKNYDEIYNIALKFKNAIESDGSCTEVALNNLLSKYSVNNPTLRKVFDISKRDRWFATLPEVNATQFIMRYVPADLAAASLQSKLREKSPNEIVNGYISKINSLEGMSSKEVRKLYNDIDSLLKAGSK